MPSQLLTLNVAARFTMTRRHTAHFTGQEVLLPSAGAEEPRWPSAMHALSHCAHIGLCARTGRLQRASTPRWLRRRRRRRRCKAVGALPRTGSLIISSTKAGNSRRAAGRGRWLSKARNLWPYQMAPVSMLPVAGMLLVAGDGIRRPPGWPRKAAGGGGSASRLSCPSWQAVAPAAPAG